MRKIVRRNVPAQMVHGNKRFARSKRKPFRKVYAHKQRPDKPRSGCNGNAVNAVKAHLCIGKSLFHNAYNIFRVPPGGDFGHDAAVKPMLRHLGIYYG